MIATINQCIAGKIEGDFVVFLIGARINRWWKFLSFVSIDRAMSRMIEALNTKPDLGLLHVKMWNDNPTLTLPYWRWFDHLREYARMGDAEHLPAWADFNKRVGSHGDFGIWHETIPGEGGTI